jgi:hypothetical protein
MGSQEYVRALDRYGENFVRRAKQRTRKLQRQRRTMTDTKKDRPRAAISPNDVELLKKAVGHYIKTCEQYCVAEQEMSEALALYHRLGRLQ